MVDVAALIPPTWRCACLFLMVDVATLIPPTWRCVCLFLMVDVAALIPLRGVVLVGFEWWMSLR
jgi:hypothetical protein